jgi:hypothetical protein
MQPAGQPFTITIRDGDKVVWEQKLLSENRPVRRVPFRVSGEETSRSRGNEAAATTLSGSQCHGPANRAEGNHFSSGRRAGALEQRRITAVFARSRKKRHILILDGRPRWESRYLRNMFERDEQWEVNAVVAGTRAG